MKKIKVQKIKDIRQGLNTPEILSFSSHLEAIKGGTGGGNAGGNYSNANLKKLLEG